MSDNLEKYSNLFERIAGIIEQSRQRIVSSVNTEMVRCYWEIGKEIVEEEQKGSERAEYGKAIINNLSNQLSRSYGKGFDSRNLWNMKRFYLVYPKVNALRSELSWTHYRLLLKIEEENKRSFYEIESINNNWSTRELDRQINSLLFERLALSKDKEGVLALAKNGHSLSTPEDMVKDPYILEFLGLKENEKLYENNLELVLEAV